MARWLQQDDLWLLEPDSEPRGLIEFIGGTVLAATPQLSYRRLLEALAARRWRVHAWSYAPGFDHQSQANAAWRRLRQARAAWDPGAADRPAPVRIGHSLGCKLHLLAPDGGRGASGLVALSFNNFSAERSVPLLAELGEQFNFRSEFSPSPQETLELVRRSHRLPRNLLVRFNRDGIDQSRRLLAVLRERPEDASELRELPGDHLTPSSAGLRRQLLGAWADDPSRQRAVEQLAGLISDWC
jgi:hypothetical protein